MSPAWIANVPGLRQWFADQLDGLGCCSPEALAYVAGLLGSMRVGDDMSKSSIVLAFRDAGASNDFAAFQRIGDWVLFASAVFPERIEADKRVAEALGRLSYTRCHRMLMGKWLVYEELADGLPLIASRVGQRVRSFNVR